MNSMKWLVIYVALFAAFFQSTTSADEIAVSKEFKYLSVSASAGRKFITGVGVDYTFDATTGAQVNTTDKLWGETYNGAIEARIPDGTFLSGSFFGENPTLSLRAAYAVGSKDEATGAIGDSANNRILGITGQVESTTLNGIQHSKSSLDHRSFDVALALSGQLKPDDWSIVPVSGLSYRSMHQRHRLTVKFVGAANDRPLFENRLSSDMYGARFGINAGTPRFHGFRMTAGGDVGAYYARSKLFATQDRYSVINNYSDQEVQDTLGHFVFEPNIFMSVDYKLGFVSLGLEATGKMAIGAPNIHLPEKENDVAEVRTDQNQYSGTAMLRAEVSF
jgi:hypothetical protein